MQQEQNIYSVIISNYLMVLKTLMKVSITIFSIIIYIIMDFCCIKIIQNVADGCLVLIYRAMRFCEFKKYWYILLCSEMIFSKSWYKVQSFIIIFSIYLHFTKYWLDFFLYAQNFWKVTSNESDGTYIFHMHLVYKIYKHFQLSLNVGR